MLNSVMPRAWSKSGLVMEGKKLGHGKFLLELWTAIQDINGRLKEYSELHENVEYFDANDVFFVSDEKSNGDKKELRINEHLMNDYLHPSEVGHKLWGDRIVERLDELIK